VHSNRIRAPSVPPVRVDRFDLQFVKLVAPRVRFRHVGSG
jgi:hypothetical protein